MDFGVWLPLMEGTLVSPWMGTVPRSHLRLLQALDVSRVVRCWGEPCEVRFHGVTVVTLAHPSLCFLLLFSDVLCPSVRVEGDRFQHTNGGAKEITGERETATPHTCFANIVCWT